MFRGTSHFYRLLEKCTSQMNIEPDWSSIMALCDTIRSGETNPKYAVAQIKKRFYHENPHVSFFALQVMESCVKNCGSFIHEVIATREFMEEVRELIKATKDESMKGKLLEMIQTWGHAFAKSQKYRICTETYNIMKAEGWKFPPVVEADAMFEADTAPAWVDGTVCHRCRVEFGVMTRQHHCRACGQVFCSKCSSKTSSLPKFGIEKDVRVCESCFEAHGPKESTISSLLSPGHLGKNGKHSEDLPPEYLASALAQQSQAPPPPKSGKSEAEIKEEEELQLALALSKSEAEEKEKRRGGGWTGVSSSNGSGSSNREQQTSSSKPKTENEIDPELMRYLDRDFWEMKEKEKKKSSSSSGSAQNQNNNNISSSMNGGGLDASSPSSGTPLGEEPKKDIQSTTTSSERVALETQKGGIPEGFEDLNEFIRTLKTQVEIFVNRMKSNSSRGRSITNDSSVQTLFMNTMSMHSQLLKHIQVQEDKRVYYEGLQDKLVQVKDARAALDALREEERERKRREAEEAERLRQAQMQEKLEVMRKQKQEFLQYQRQVALQRMQEQELLLRQEQAKHQMYNNPQAYGMWPPGQAAYYPPHPMPPQYTQDPYNMQMIGSALPGAPQQHQAPGAFPMAGHPPSLPNMTPGMQQHLPPPPSNMQPPPPHFNGAMPSSSSMVAPLPNAHPQQTSSAPMNPPQPPPPPPSEQPLEEQLIIFD
eukprot:TRINITY_DN2137_c0_g1_i1.p1 TRINITY_DN2137_c0_g1~~TRINITY_DN2137_c0_g1_i1.p1  ORF type:complete len:708 (+),score=268.56 TRINITY_DN2137_c0_g1_i1:229-2352(+)